VADAAKLFAITKEERDMFMRIIRVWFRALLYKYKKKKSVDIYYKVVLKRCKTFVCFTRVVQESHFLKHARARLTLTEELENRRRKSASRNKENREKQRGKREIYFFLIRFSLHYFKGEFLASEEREREKKRETNTLLIIAHANIITEHII
jgi:hypothetical protein|tara:strand:- start:47 stop:499 length:453 start_codon:yes stop_codon:yes gene_type:complete